MRGSTPGPDLSQARGIPKGVTVNGGGSAGGRGTPRAEAQRDGRSRVGTEPSQVLPGFSPEPGGHSLIRYTAPSYSPLPPPPRPTRPHTAALGSWGSQQGSRSAVGSHGSWREYPARGSGPGCAGRSPAPRESSLAFGPSTTPAGQDRHGVGVGGCLEVSAVLLDHIPDCGQSRSWPRRPVLRPDPGPPAPRAGITPSLPAP